MIKQFKGETADEVWRYAAESLVFEDENQLEESRLGSVKEYLHCSLCLRNPRQRWVLSRKPAINPAFAIAELIWILQGRNDAAFLNYWNPVLPRFSGADETYYGAYGRRLRVGLGFDQIDRAYRILTNNPSSRQVVLQIWDGQKDMPNKEGQARAADIPCNVIAMPKVRAGKLEWMQIMRSNDLFLGTPHNFIQFTSLQEIMAGWLGLDVGSFVLITDSLHVYVHDLEKLQITEKAPYAPNTDSLALPKDEFDHVLLLMGNAMDELRNDSLSPARFTTLLDETDLPISWRNLLRIVAADVARRRDWADEMKNAADQCTNLALNVAWKAWLERCLSPTAQTLS